MKQKLHDKMENNWLLIYPETFIFSDENKILFYNSNTNNYLEFNNDNFFKCLYKELNNIDNFYCVKVTNKKFINYKFFFELIHNQGFGKHIVSKLKDRPLSFPPIHKLHVDINTIRYDYHQNEAGYILNFLNELTIYLSGNSNDNIIFKQTIYPLKGNDKVDSDELLKFMETIKGSTLNVINIICDLMFIQNFYNVFEYLNYNKYNVNFFLKFEDLENSNFKQLQSLYVFNTYVICTVNDKPVDDLFNYIFIVSNNSELSKIENDCLTVKKIEIVPIIDSDNTDFFAENIFSTKKELLALNPSKREFFVKKELNTNFFGKLTILPNGYIYANVNTPALGSLKDSLYELLYKEIDSKNAWLMVRDRDPCNSCRFQYICPSISNYELLLGRFNLCNIKDSNY